MPEGVNQYDIDDFAIDISRAENAKVVEGAVRNEERELLKHVAQIIMDNTDIGNYDDAILQWEKYLNISIKG